VCLEPEILLVDESISYPERSRRMGTGVYPNDRALK